MGKMNEVADELFSLFLSLKDYVFRNSEQGSRKMKITLDDIEEEVLFWKPSIVCYVLGVNPPLHILEGFANRIWKDKVDRVKRDQVINRGYIFFNRRPVIMKSWDPNVNFKKEDVKCVPIWVQLEELELKYWGQRSLFKIVGQLGKPLMVDSFTKERERLNYPTVLVEVIMDQHLPDMLEFENEFGSNTSVGIKYEWKPVTCSHCFGIGHSTTDCKKVTNAKQHWVTKKDNRKVIETDEEGFTKVSKGKKVDMKEKSNAGAAVTVTNNTFQALSLEELNGTTNGDIAENGIGTDGTTAEYESNIGGGSSLSFQWINCYVGMVKAPKLGALYSNVFDGWCFSSNIAWYAGGKIAIGWNPCRFTVDIIKCTSQLIHLKISTVESFNSFLTVVYAFNNRGERRLLWKDICELYSDENWCLMGDFNDILAKEERVGLRVRSYPDSDFFRCVNFRKLEDVKASKKFFTWTNKQPGADRIYSKIDRIMANQAWITKYEFVEAVFLNEGLFDHSPGILSLHPGMVGGSLSSTLRCGNLIQSMMIT
ncbi:uncharacterized protein LOC115703846 [Cannabis sativa]|uniref:uncharacterized protein LOC115703846 n=1 Tax=Cannabis sativa TaxID=3483 RepID=UPI0029CA5DE0|nr:uncharacterized protein LOC115703846 [Cannabis sativa]